LSARLNGQDFGSVSNVLLLTKIFTLVSRTVQLCYSQTALTCCTFAYYW